MMERWTALGNGIAKRMPYLVLVCLATGVLLPDVFSPVSYTHLTLPTIRLV